MKLWIFSHFWPRGCLWLHLVFVWHSEKCLQYVCVCACVCVCAFSCVQLFVTPWTVARPASVHEILQAGILEHIAVSSSRGSSWPRDRTCISCTSCIYHSAPWEAPFCDTVSAQWCVSLLLNDPACLQARGLQILKSHGAIIIIIWGKSPGTGPLMGATLQFPKEQARHLSTCFFPLTVSISVCLHH